MTIWILTSIDDAKPLRAYRNKGRGEQDLELLNALEGIDGFELNELPIYDADEPAIATLATSTKPVEKKDALAECIAVIRDKFIMPLTSDVSDRMAQEQLKKLGYNFRLPTVRNALIAISKESRASAQPESDAIRKEQGSPSDSAPESGGAGASDDFPETPAFLKRAPSREAAE